MAMELAGELARVVDDEAHVLGIELAGVADLAAGFRIERRAVEDHDRFVASGDRIDRAAILEQRHHDQRRRSASAS